MMLFTHSIVGASIVSMFPNNPALGIPLALFSHYLSDSIPHWEYNIKAPIFNKKNPDREHQLRNFSVYDKLWSLRYDNFSILVDFSIGICVSLYIFYHLYHVSWILVLFGVLAGVLPDIGQFAYVLFPEKMKVFQKFHTFWHSSIHWHNKPFWGTLTQFAVLLFVVLFFVFVTNGAKI